MGLYAANFVFTRFSLLEGLAPGDLVALRYAVSGALLLPWVASRGLRSLGGVGWTRGVVLACLAGAPYMLLFNGGLEFSPAAHGAVLNPGTVPIVVSIGVLLLGGPAISVPRAVSLVVIVPGLVLVTSASFSMQDSVLLGDLLLLASGISWGTFTVLLKRWSVRPLDAAAVVSVLSMVYLPIHFLFADTALGSVSLSHVMMQGMFQGIVMSVGTLYLIAFAIERLGAEHASLFSPLVPLMTLAVSIPILGEEPASRQWLGVLIVVAGMAGAAYSSTRRA